LTVWGVGVHCVLVDSGREAEEAASVDAEVVLLGWRVPVLVVETGAGNSVKNRLVVISGESDGVQGLHSVFGVPGRGIGHGLGFGDQPCWIVEESQDVGEHAVTVVSKKPEVCGVGGNFGRYDGTDVTDEIVSRIAPRDGLEQGDEGARDAEKAKVKSTFDLIK
jgi:hypothetical protein